MEKPTYRLTGLRSPMRGLKDSTTDMQILICTPLITTVKIQTWHTIITDIQIQYNHHEQLNQTVKPKIQRQADEKIHTYIDIDYSVWNQCFVLQSFVNFILILSVCVPFDGKLLNGGGVYSTVIILYVADRYIIRDEIDLPMDIRISKLYSGECTNNGIQPLSSGFPSHGFAWLLFAI